MAWTPVRFGPEVVDEIVALRREELDKYDDAILLRTQLANLHRQVALGLRPRPGSFEDCRRRLASEWASFCAGLRKAVKRFSA